MQNETAVPAAAGMGALPRSSNRDYTLGTLADAYMAAYRGRDGSRGPHLRTWLELLGDVPLTGIDADLVHDALEHLASTPARRYLGRDCEGNPKWKHLGLRSNATLNRHRASLSALFSWAKRRRLVPRDWTNPCKEIEGLPEGPGRVRFLTTEERARLLAVTKVSTWHRLHLLVSMALVTGARRSELLGLRYADLDLIAGTASLGRTRRTKNDDRRTLVLTPPVVLEIRRLGIGEPGALVFASQRKPDQAFQFGAAWQKALADARIEDFHFHDLRHTTASYLAQAGASLLEIADVLGHRSLDVTRRYSHLTVDSKRNLVMKVLGGVL